jgi:hypothetical protein
MNRTLEELVFILEEDPKALDKVKPTDVLHACNPRFTTRNKMMPPGATEADVWIARHGDPLASAEAALFLCREVATLEKMAASVDYKTGHATVRLFFTGADSTGVTPHLSSAICTALLNYLHKLESL